MMRVYTSIYEYITRYSIYGIYVAIYSMTYPLFLKSLVYIIGPHVPIIWHYRILHYDLAPSPILK